MAALQTREHLQQQDALGETLAQVAARVRNQRRVRGGVRGLIAALVVDIVLAGLSRAALLSGGFPLFPALFILAAFGAVSGAALASRFPITAMDAACLAEARLPLKERLSSALEFGQTALFSPLLGLQHADAEAHARALDTRQIAPRRVPREAWLALSLLLALAAMLWLPILPFGPSPAQRAEQDAVRLAGRQLAQAAHQAAKQADARRQPEAKRQAQKLEALGKRMAQGRIDRAQALAAVSQQEQQLAPSGQSALPNSNDPGQAAKDLAGAGKPPASSIAQPSASPKGASAAASSPSVPHAPSGQAGPQTSSAAAPQTQARTAPSKSSGLSPGPAVPRQTTSASAPGGSPNKQTGSSAAAQSPPLSRPFSPAGKTRRAAEAASRRQQSASPVQGTPEARRALENARRQLAGSAAPQETPPAKPNAANNPPPLSAAPKPGRAPRPGLGGKPGSASSPSAGKPSGQGKGVGGKPTGAGKPIGGAPNGQSQGSGGKPNGPPSPAGKGRDGRPGQGKMGSQSLGNSGGGAGQPAPGGGAGRAAKFPFRSALPPTSVSKGQGIYLGTPGQNSAQGKSLHPQPGVPSAPAGPSRVPYGQALPRYRKGAEAALDQEQVPPSQRAVVRNYFNALQSAK